MKQHASFRPRKDSPKKESEMLDLEAFVVELFVLRNSCVPVVKNLLYRLVSFSGLVQPCGTNNVSETSLGQHPTVRDFCFFLFPFLKKTRRPPHSSAETQERGGTCPALVYIYCQSMAAEHHSASFSPLHSLSLPSVPNTGTEIIKQANPRRDRPPRSFAMIQLFDPVASNHHQTDCTGPIHAQLHGVTRQYY